ncbi:MAG: hypothetical protein JNL83_15115 [Myxococcales bacterium]|nr:hypothetical protein [Myxococcales bacterium]
MRADDIIHIVWMVKRATHGANTPVTIQREIERDAAGRRVDVGMTPRLSPEGSPFQYGASVGPRPS